MSVKIRLRRMGRNKQPFYRVVATDSRCSNSGRFLENLGWYDPTRSGTNFTLKMDRVEYWTGNGAILSDTVKSLVRKARKGEPMAAAGVASEPAAPTDVEPVPATGPAVDAEIADTPEEGVASGEPGEEATSP